MIASFLMEDKIEFENTQRAMIKMVSWLTANNLPYAVIGGMAVRLHGHKRFTSDADFLLTKVGYVQAQKLVGNGYHHATYQDGRIRESRLHDEENGNATIDLGISDESVQWPGLFNNRVEIDGLEVIRISRLIDMKLAAGRYQDKADVVSLIRVNKVEREFCGAISESNHKAWHEAYDETEKYEE